MSTARNRIVHKHFRLDASEIKRAQRLLKTGTETETVERALDAVIAQHEWNRLTREANERLVKSGIEIRDVYGKGNSEILVSSAVLRAAAQQKARFA